MLGRPPGFHPSTWLSECRASASHRLRKPRSKTHPETLPGLGLPLERRWGQNLDFLRILKAQSWDSLQLSLPQGQRASLSNCSKGMMGKILDPKRSRPTLQKGRRGSQPYSYPKSPGPMWALLLEPKVVWVFVPQPTHHPRPISLTERELLPGMEQR